MKYSFNHIFNIHYIVVFQYIYIATNLIPTNKMKK